MTQAVVLNPFTVYILHGVRTFCMLFCTPNKYRNSNNNACWYRDFIINSFINLSFFPLLSLFVWIFLLHFSFLFSLCWVTIKTHIPYTVRRMAASKVWNILAIVLLHAPNFCTLIFLWSRKLCVCKWNEYEKISQKKIKNAHNTHSGTHIQAHLKCAQGHKNIIRFNCWWHFFLSSIFAMLYSTRDLVIVYLIYTCVCRTLYWVHTRPLWLRPFCVCMRVFHSNEKETSKNLHLFWTKAYNLS